MNYWRTLALVAALALGSTPVVRAQATITFGSNLITNGDAESGAVIKGGSYVVDNWTVLTGPAGNNGFSAVDYGGTGNGPSSGSPGPMPASSRGARHFFGGLSGKSSSAQQIITGSTPAVQAAIDAGTVGFDLSGWLGGYSNQDDKATLTLRFLDGTGTALGTAVLGPVTNTDRANITGLLFRQTQGNVPAGTRSLELTMLMTWSYGGQNNACADNLALVLTTKDVIFTLPAGGVTATEGGATGSYSVALATAPTANVDITLTPDSQVTVSPPTLTFTPANFATPQTVTVTAFDDTLVEGDHTGVIAHSAASADAAYNGVAISDVTVAITDNEIFIPPPDTGVDDSGGTDNGEGAYWNTPGPTTSEGGCHLGGEGAFLTLSLPRLLGPYAVDAQGGLAPLPAPPPGSHALVLRSAPPRSAPAPAPAASLAGVAVALLAALLLLGGAIAAGRRPG